MKLLLFALALAPMLADEASKRARIEEMLKLTNADALTNQVIQQVRNMALQNATRSGASDPQGVQTRVLDLLKQEMSWEKMKPDYVKLYDELFTEEELDGIVAFYRSPAGQAMTKKMPQLVQRSMQMSQQKMTEIMPKIKQIIEENQAAKPAPAKPVPAK